jgi:hypothetical protein
MRFAKKKTVQVALRCEICKNVTNYPLKVFPRREYRKQGYIMQFCGCDKWRKGADGLGNTKHKVIGVFVEQQLPLSTTEAKELLGNLVS